MQNHFKGISLVTGDFTFLSSSSKGICKILAVNNSLKDGEVQSGPSSKTISRIQCGKEVDSLQTSGLVLKKSVMSFFDRWSAKVLVALGI